MEPIFPGRMRDPYKVSLPASFLPKSIAHPTAASALITTEAREMAAINLLFARIHIQLAMRRSMPGAGKVIPFQSEKI